MALLCDDSSKHESALRDAVAQCISSKPKGIART